MIKCRSADIFMDAVDALAKRDVEVELDVTPNVERVIENFNSAVDSLFIAYMRNKVDELVVKVKVINLSSAERDELDAVLFSYCHWLVAALDHCIWSLSPAKLFTSEQIKEAQIKNLVSSGRFCERCYTFTEHRKDTWVCPVCGDLVTCHAGTDIAMGKIADKAQRKLREQTHLIVDRLWLDKFMTRDEVYESIADLIHAPKNGTHIATLSAAQCALVQRWAKAAYKDIKERKINGREERTGNR